MKLDDMTVEDITRLAAIATGLLSLAVKLGFMVSDFVNKVKEDLPDEDKEVLKAKIKEAQDKVKDWDAEIS